MLHSFNDERRLRRGDTRRHFRFCRLNLMIVSKLVRRFSIVAAETFPGLPLDSRFNLIRFDLI